MAAPHPRDAGLSQGTLLTLGVAGAGGVGSATAFAASQDIETSMVVGVVMAMLTVLGRLTALAFDNITNTQEQNRTAEARHEAQLADLKAKHDRQLEDLQAKHDRELRDVYSQISSLRVAFMDLAVKAATAGVPVDMEQLQRELNGRSGE